MSTGLDRVTAALARPAALRGLGAAGVAIVAAGAVTLVLMTDGAASSAAPAGPGSSTVSTSAGPTTTATTSVPTSRAATAAVTAAARRTTSPGDTRVVHELAANGIPVVALTAYRRAAARLANADPSCGVPWYLVAAIGKVESDHGRYGGAALSANGDSIPHIVGIALDGSRSAYIGDTDGGRLDGDTRYDRAVGPMQFIPSTWARYAVDGNGDGRADPFNIDDAALATAHYLCVAGGNLRTETGIVNAVLAYNHSSAYLNLVYSLAMAYAHGVKVGGPVSGPTTGALPPVRSGPQPPADPGVPPVLATRGRSAATTAPRQGSRPSSHPRTSAVPTRTTAAPKPTPRPTPPRTPTTPRSTPPRTTAVPIPTLLPTSPVCTILIVKVC